MTDVKDLEAGDLVIVERTNQHDGETIKYETLLFAPYPNDAGHLQDGLALTVRDWRHKESNSLVSVNVLKKVAKPNYFYRNADRPPVVGDIYLTPNGKPSIIRGNDVDSASDLLSSGTLAWAEIENHDPFMKKNVRTLIWDAKEGKRMPYEEDLSW